MATTLLALKLAYGIGEGKRTPLYPHEIGAIQIDMDRYCDFLQEFVNRGREGRVDGEVGFKITEKDALDMSAEDMDRYLDWYEKKWLLDANTNGVVLGHVACCFSLTRSSSFTDIGFISNRDLLAGSQQADRRGQSFIAPGQSIGGGDFV